VKNFLIIDKTYQLLKPAVFAGVRKKCIKYEMNTKL